MSLEHISYSLNRQGCFLASLLKAAEPSSKCGRAERQVAARHPEGWRLFHKVVSRKPSALAQRTKLFSLTFSGAEKEAKFRVP